MPIGPISAVTERAIQQTNIFHTTRLPLLQASDFANQEKNISTIRKVIFDMDGVLVDSRESLLNAYSGTCSRFNIVPDSSRFSSLLGGTLEEIFESLHPAQPSEILSQEFRTISTKLSVKTYDGIHALLESLRSNGLVLAIATNKDLPRAEKIAKSQKLEISEVLSPSAGYLPKPDPSMLLAAMGHFRPAEVLFVGDTSTDQAAARSAGCHFVHAAWGYEPGISTEAGEFVARSPTQLREIISEITAK